MARKPRKKREQSQKRAHKGLYKDPVMAISNNVVFTKKAAWAYYVLAEKPYDFLPAEGVVKMANSTNVALAALATRSDALVECHLLVTNHIFNPVRWEQQMRRVHALWVRDYNRPFDTFVRNQATTMRDGNYRRRVTLLGIKLYNRGSLDLNFNVLEMGIEKSKEFFRDAVSAMFKLPNERISATEEARARKQERDYYAIISSGGLDARRPTAEDLLLTIKRAYYPSMPSPYLDVSHDERIGLADVAIETGGEVYVHPRYLRMRQFVDGDFHEGYRATLAIAKFPADMQIPSVVPPFFARTSVLPYTVFSRFYLVPTEKMKSDLNKKKLEAEDEIANLQGSGQSVTAELRSTVTDITLLEEELTETNMPWVNGSYYITIDAPTESLIKETITRIQQEYAESDTHLVWISGAQLQLFREEQIGGDIENKDFQHIISLPILAMSGMNSGSYVGDPIT